MYKNIVAFALLFIVLAGCKEKTDGSNLENQTVSQAENSEVDSSRAYISEMIKGFVGQYAAKVDGAGYYKLMIISETNDGKWKVDIKVKSESDKTVICDFIGTGVFKDKDLMVPLNDVNANLKGTLIIRFVDSFAIVYTEDTADYKEMVAFCNGKGSIAGNFKKTLI